MKIVINPQYKNLSHFVHELPQNFDNIGKVLHQGRNQVKAFQVEGYNIVVKRYKRPNLIQRVIYTFFVLPRHAVHITLPFRYRI